MLCVGEAPPCSSLTDMLTAVAPVHGGLWGEEIKDQPFDSPLCGRHKNNWPAVTWLTLQSIPNHMLVENSEITKLSWGLRLMLI